MNIAGIRKAVGLTQQELSEKLGVQQNTVSQWESGLRNVPSKLLPVLADTLHCTIDELFGRSEPGEAEQDSA